MNPIIEISSSGLRMIPTPVETGCPGFGVYLITNDAEHVPVVVVAATAGRAAEIWCEWVHEDCEDGCPGPSAHAGDLSQIAKVAEEVLVESIPFTPDRKETPSCD